MSQPAPEPDEIVWIKRKRDEIDALATSLGGLVAELEGDARVRAHRSLADLLGVRTLFAETLDTIHARQDARGCAGEAVAALADEWTKVDAAFRSFLFAASGKLHVIEGAMQAKPYAKSMSIELAVHQALSASAHAFDQAKREVDEIIGRIAAEQLRLGTFSTSSDNALKALKSGVEETRRIYYKAWDNIAEVLSGHNAEPPVSQAPPGTAAATAAAPAAAPRTCSDAVGCGG